MRKGTLITITSPRYTILEDYITDYRSPFYPAALRKDKNKTGEKKFDWAAYSRQIVAWKTEDGEANYRRIETAFATQPDKLEEIERINLNYQANDRGYLDMPLKSGIQLYIPLDQVSKEALLNDGVEIVAYNDPAFKASVLAQLEAQDKYIPSSTLKSANFESISAKHLNYSIWIWCRSLSDSNKGPLEGELINVTPFVTSFSTSTNKSNGGNFSITLQPIPAIRDRKTGKWIIDPNCLIYNKEDDTYISTAHVHQYEVVSGGKINKARTPFYFNNILNTNDLVFIRKEALAIEEDERKQTNEELTLSTNILADKIYDMIGLIDMVGTTEQFENLDIQNTVTGRDLSKLFIEDGTYFYSMENKQGILHWHGGATSDNPYLQRVVNTNSYLYLGMYYNNSIEDILRFVIQQLTNIEICPSSVFTSYKTAKTNIQQSQTYGVPREILEAKDRTNKRWGDDLFKQNQVPFKDNTKELATRLRQQVTAFRMNEFTPDFTHKSVDLTQTTQVVAQNLINFFRYLLNAKLFVVDNANQLQGWEMTSYDGEDLSANEFPKSLAADRLTDYKGLFFSFVDRSHITFADADKTMLQTAYDYVRAEKNNKEVQLDNNGIEDAKGIWQIVKLVIDSKVGHRWLIDSSLSSATGSLMNYLQKVAQQPFVELFMDTYGDQFYITVRQPPTDKVGMLSYLTGHYQNGIETDTGRDVVINIQDQDVVSDTLVFDDKEVYAWYHFVPQGAIIGSSSQFSTAHIPALFFPEYAAIWGAKSLDLVHNYSNYFSQFASNYKNNNKVSNLQKQGYYDLKFLVDSHQYLPFTRKGTITLKGGDRRYKIGNPIRLESTGEIFWIDGIHDTHTINDTLERAVTLQVSRGMVEAFIHGIKGSELNKRFSNHDIRFTPEKTFSYFDIINTQLNLTKTRKVQKYKTVIEEIEEDIPLEELDQEADADLLGAIQSEARMTSVSNMSHEIEREIKRLDTRAQPVFRQFFSHLEKIGWQVILTSGKRSYAEQMTLWLAAGKRNVAKPGTSRHETGLAVDINLIAKRDIGGIAKGTHLKLGGKTEAMRAAHKPLWIKAGIPTIAREFNLMWGGWYRNYSDNVHFQLALTPLAQEQQQEQTRTRKITKTTEVEDGVEDVLDETSVFENFKVDEEIFNFFLRKQHTNIFKTTK